MRSCPHSEVIAKRLDDAAILVDLRTSRIFELNATGTRIWELLSEVSDEAQLARHLAEEFAIDEQEAARETARLIAELRAEGLLE
jgi:hypothetical protein